MVPWCRSESTIARLRLRGAPADPLAARLRIDRVLNETSLAPSALPPSAILCIRNLADPLPGSLALQGDSPRASAAWTRALTSAVARMAERAARPALGAVPSDVPAIVFLDQAELLACLASDWCDGSLARRWWWRSLFPNADLGRLAATAWQRRPEQVPAAFEYLSHGARLLPFIRKLDVAGRAVLLDRVTTAFGLPELRAELVSLAARERIPSHRDDHAEVSPWSSRVPEAAPSLRLDEQCLLGVCLMLQRASSQARSREFLRAVREWGRKVTVPGILSAVAMSPPESAARARNVAQRGTVDSSPSPVGGDQEGQAPGGEISRQSPFSSLSSRALPDHDCKASIQDRVRTGDVERAVSRATAVFQTPAAPLGRGTSAARPFELPTDPRSTVAGPIAWRALNEPMDARPPDPTAAAHRVQVSKEELADSSPLAFDQEPAARFANATTASGVPAALPPYASPRALPTVTTFGGLFYLINVGIYLELYGDFTAPAKPGIALSIWDFIAAIGKRVIGDRLYSDPVWELLAHLAGREDAEAPGHDFEPPREWRIPVAWLDSLPSSATWRWSGRRGRLTLRHPAGFLIVDVPRDFARTPDDQLELELQPYRAARRVRLRPAPVRARTSPSRFDWWLDRALEYLQARLAQALRLRDRHTIGPALIEHDARVFLTGSELDVVFSLADLPLAIRLAGLDRNPGWVPAAGRRIAFVFE